MIIVPYVIELSQIDWTRIQTCVLCLRYSFSFVCEVNNKCLHRYVDELNNNLGWCQSKCIFISYTFLFAESVFHSFLTSLSFHLTKRKWIDVLCRHFDEERVWLSLDDIHTDNCFRFKLKANKGIEYNSKLIANKWKTFNWINIDVQSERFNTIGSFHNDIHSAAQFFSRYLDIQMWWIHIMNIELSKYLRLHLTMLTYYS